LFDYKVFDCKVFDCKVFDYRVRGDPAFRYRVFSGRVRRGKCEEGQV
jgi:hypothetical protein